MTSTARVRRFRARNKLGRAVFAVELDTVELEQMRVGCNLMKLALGDEDATILIGSVLAENIPLAG